MERDKSWPGCLSKKNKKAPCRRQSEKWKPKQDILFLDGFRMPRCPCKAEEPPQLPPNQYIREYQTAILIPYKEIGLGKRLLRVQWSFQEPGAVMCGGRWRGKLGDPPTRGGKKRYVWFIILHNVMLEKEQEKHKRSLSGYFKTLLFKSLTRITHKFILKQACLKARKPSKVS